MSATEGQDGKAGAGEKAGRQYTKPAQEQELRADLEEIWQGESPATARRTEFADQVDGRLGTRHRIPDEDES